MRASDTLVMSVNMLALCDFAYATPDEKTHQSSVQIRKRPSFLNENTLLTTKTPWILQGSHYKQNTKIFHQKEKYEMKPEKLNLQKKKFYLGRGGLVVQANKIVCTLHSKSLLVLLWLVLLLHYMYQQLNLFFICFISCHLMNYTLLYT